MGTRTLQETGRRVLVRLSDVPVDLRLEVADTLIEKGRLRGDDAIALKAAALVPVHDPVAWVPWEKARLVLREGRLPTGSWKGYL